MGTRWLNIHISGRYPTVKAGFNFPNEILSRDGTEEAGDGFDAGGDGSTTKRV